MLGACSVLVGSGFGRTSTDSEVEDEVELLSAIVVPLGEAWSTLIFTGGAVAVIVVVKVVVLWMWMVVTLSVV